MRFKSLGLSVIGIVLTTSIAISSSKSNEIIGRVVGVSDGDTITVLDATKTPHKIRLNAIDAPESHQAFGQRSKQTLSAKIFDRDVRVATYQRDKYGRVIGDIYLDDRCINKEMVEEGWAWHYKKYSTSPSLDEAEKKARATRAGLWVDVLPVAPWDFRHPVLDANVIARENAAGPDEVTVYVTRTGTKYHRSGCRFLSKSSIPTPLSQAKPRFSPCSVCKPPQ